MSPAKRAAYYRFSAKACERAAEKWAASHEPWAIANSRAFQKLMCDALKSRNAILSRYLARRKRRLEDKGTTI